MFGVDLATVALSGMVEHPVVRQRLDEAENALGEGRAGDAFSAARRALEAARMEWKRHRQVPMRTALTRHNVRGAPEPREVEEALREVDDLAEVEPFAADLGEYL